MSMYKWFPNFRKEKLVWEKAFIDNFNLVGKSGEFNNYEVYFHYRIVKL